DKQTYPDASSYFESNQISARLNKKSMAIHVKYGGENDGYVSLAASMNHSEDEKYSLNTSEWHVYRFVFHADNLNYDVYIDDMDEPVFENIAAKDETSTSNILRLGAETTHRCNMDIEYAKMGMGDFNSKSKITSVSVSSDSHIVNHARTVSATVSTALIDNGEKLLLSLADENGADEGTPVEITVSAGKATGNLTVPASVSAGKYQIKASAPNGKIGDVTVKPKGVQYVVAEESPIDGKMLPQVKPVGFVIGIDDYTYKNSSNEFIFPAIIDAKQYTLDGKFRNGQDTLARYYRFYTPHENPGGMYLATGPTLDGPWTERNTVIDLVWAKAVPNNIINTADHISACQVVWNDVYNKFFMYFHGPNSTTHYATSDNLVDWSFGGSILEAKQFSSAGTEASYAKVFEHKIPRLNNKYVLMLMIMEGLRKIYWAYSDDGVAWTPVKKPLISPDLNYKKIPGTDIKPNYSGSFGNNVSGPFLMERNGRYFVFCNGSSGNMFVVEVGESFDMEIHWGEYMKAADVVIDTDDNGNPAAVPRIAAPQFIRNDRGVWYMFFEAGSRLGANIAYAREDDETLAVSVFKSNSVIVYPSVVGRGEKLTLNVKNAAELSAEIIDITGRRVAYAKVAGSSGEIQSPTVQGVYFIKVNQLGASKIIVK
ncbi:MAG: T9SS type A sorting domain-containing protein, partial [Prevotella sp.]|nr:T9SS type A sorting domain-containing protein [Prevotella sp.]